MNHLARAIVDKIVRVVTPREFILSPPDGVVDIVDEGVLVPAPLVEPEDAVELDEPCVAVKVDEPAVSVEADEPDAAVEVDL